MATGIVREYIGARYVPKFFENENNTPEWAPNVQYEPLTIVTYNQNSYTSKKPVPASVPVMLPVVVPSVLPPVSVCVRESWRV